MSEYKRFQEGVVKSILARPEAIVEVLDHIDSTDFDDANFKLIYESAMDLHLEKKNISLAEIALKIGEAGGSIDTAWLFGLESNISSWVQAASPVVWAKLLKRESSKAKAIEVLKQGIEEINQAGVDPLNEMSSISSKLTEVSINATSSEAFNIKDAVERFRDDSAEIIRTGGKIAALSSAYPSIDHYTQGWAPTHLITVGARTGIGKSVFAINNAIAAMKQGKAVLFFSLEMTEREVISRMVASLAMLPIQQVEKAYRFTEEEQIRHDEALAFIEQSKLVIEDDPQVTVEHIKRASIKQSQSDDGLDFIIIDYLQLIMSTGKRSRQEEVADVSRNMKILAKELNVPVMVLVQLLRERRDDEGDQMPKLFEIRESGAIAQDSNVVILIHRDKDKDSEVIDPKAVFIIAKNRQGEDNRFISVRTRLESSLFIDDNVKGQEVILDLEQSTLEDGEGFSYESTAYQNPPEGAGNEDFAQLFSNEEGFGEDSGF